MDTQQFTITKSNVEMYKLRHPSGMFWADITIDASDESGRIQIASDFGSWQNFWSHCGMEFKNFLQKVNMDYVACKFSAKDYFDSDVNMKNALVQILQARREQIIDADFARECYDELIDIESECVNNEVHFQGLINNTKSLRHFYYEDGFSVSRTYDPGFKKFWVEVWPAFVDELRKETAVLTK